jgi:hypothetical protein
MNENNWNALPEAVRDVVLLELQICEGEILDFAEKCRVASRHALGARKSVQAAACSTAITLLSGKPSMWDTVWVVDRELVYFYLLREVDSAMGMVEACRHRGLRQMAGRLEGTILAYRAALSMLGYQEPEDL